MNQNKQIFNQRLLQFAEYLESGKLYHSENHFDDVGFVLGDDSGKKPMVKSISYHYWVMEYLPEIFKNFSFIDSGGISFEDDFEFTDHVNGTFIFFDLTSDEWCAIFAADGFNFQDVFKTKQLVAFCTAIDIAYNVRQVIKYRENKLLDM